MAFRSRRKEEFKIEDWTPRTVLGRRVKSGEVVGIKQILGASKPILEAEIVDALVPNLETEFINVGQAKGKFGGGKRRPMKQTQKKTAESSKISFTTVAVVGNKNGYVGVGVGKAMETVPAKEKSIRAAKKGLIEVARGCGSWECGCGEPHSLPFAVEGKCSSVKVRLLPAPKGTGLCVENELKKILKLAGYKDVWSQVSGQSVHKQNLVKACMHALRKCMMTRLIDSQRKKIVFGAKEEDAKKEAVKADSKPELPPPAPTVKGKSSVQSIENEMGQKVNGKGADKEKKEVKK